MGADPGSYPVEPPQAEAALVARIQAGEAEAFDALVRRHQQQVFAVACRLLGSRDEAEEAAQDVFVRAYRGIGGFRREAKVSTWLIAITLNVCRNRRRWWARRRQVIAGSLDAMADDPDAPALDPADPAPGPAALAQARERQRALAAALQMLEEPSRAVVVLRDVQ